MDMTTASPPRFSKRPVRLALRCKITPASFCIPRSPALLLPSAKPQRPRGAGSGRNCNVAEFVDLSLGADRGNTDAANANARACDCEWVDTATIVESPPSAAADVGDLGLLHINSAIRRKTSDGVRTDLDGGRTRGQRQPRGQHKTDQSTRMLRQGRCSFGRSEWRAQDRSCPYLLRDISHSLQSTPMPPGCRLVQEPQSRHSPFKLEHGGAARRTKSAR
jgi:hypothetical protein